MKNNDNLKQYLKDVCNLYNLQGSQSEVLFYFLTKIMSEDNLIFVNKTVKEIIARDTGMSLGTVSNFLTNSINSGIFLKVARGTYKANPNLFNKEILKDNNEISLLVSYSGDGRQVKLVEGDNYVL